MHTVLLYKSTESQPSPPHLSLSAIGLNGLGTRRDLFWAALVNRVNGAVILFTPRRVFSGWYARWCSLQSSDQSSDLFIKVALKWASCKQMLHIVSLGRNSSVISCQYDENTKNSQYNIISVKVIDEAGWLVVTKNSFEIDPANLMPVKKLSTPSLQTRVKLLF